MSDSLVTIPMDCRCPALDYWGEGVLWGSLVAQMVKNLPAMQETQVQSLGKEVPLEGMATHSSILAWRTAWTEEPGGLQSTGLQRVRHDLATQQQQRDEAK